MNLAAVLVAIVIFAGLFMLLRGLMCWYWKINELIGLQKEILAELRAANGKRGHLSSV